MEQLLLRGLRDRVRFLRVGTLDDPDQMPPYVHIFTCSKQPWIILPEQDPQVDVFYVIEEIWSAKSLERLATLKIAAGISAT